MKKRLLALVLALVNCSGLLLPASAFYTESFDYGGFIDIRHESVPGVWEDTAITYIKAESHVEISRYLEYEGEIQAVWVSVVGTSDKIYFFERSAGDALFESVTIPFTSAQTKDGKTIDLSDPSKIYTVTIEATEPDGSKQESTNFYRVVNEVNGEYVINDKAAYSNPLIFKGGLDYDSVILRNDGYFEVERNGKYGLLDNMGNEIVPPIYDRFGELSDGMLRVGNSMDGSGDWDSFKWGFINVETGQLTIPIQYDSGNTGDSSTQISDFSNGFAVLRQSKHTSYRDADNLLHMESKTQCGLIGKSGNMAIPMQEVDYVWSMGDGTMTYDFSDNRVVVKSGDKYIVMDTQGNTLFEPKFSSVAGYENGFAIITDQNGRKGFINTQGEVVVKPQYDLVHDFCKEGYAVVCKNTRYGAINRKGKLVVPIAYEYLYDFSEGMACFQVESPDSPDGSKYGFVNTSGEVVVPAIWDFADSPYQGMDFSNGLAHVAISDKRFADITTLQRKHGYIDKRGNVVIPLIYDSAGIFSNGIVHADIGVADINKFRFQWQSTYESIGRRFEELGITPQYNYIDTKGNVIFSGEKPFHGTQRFYVEKINGAFAIMRNPIYRETATPNRSAVLVNGEKVAFDAYTINQNNYFKLRDLAKVLSGTGKQFEVTWDGNNNAINMLSGKPYTTVGGELAQGDGTNKTATVNTATVYLDGQPVSLLAYTINQNNYFKLRDVGQTFDFDVTWDGANNTIVIDTNQSYTAD